MMDRIEVEPKMVGHDFTQKLDHLYSKYNRREYLHPDPLEYLYRYKEPLDREITGMIAASLAYGRVAQILRSVSIVMDKMGPSPAAFLKRSNSEEIIRKFDGFCHRFATGHHMASLLLGIKSITGEYGSLYHCFLSGMGKKDQTVLEGLSAFAEKLVFAADYNTGHLIALPGKGSSCKRLNLFLRWMVRKDAIDPGGWDNISPAQLIVPLDTHLHNICYTLGLTNRKNPNMATALDITESFRKISPKDPVKYDFVLTRFGIRADMDIQTLVGFLNESTVI